MKIQKYSQVERQLARLLSLFPSIKANVKRIHQRVNYFWHRKDVRYISKYPIEAFGEEGQETFFGYYDKSPESTAGLVTFHRSTVATTVKPSIKDAVKIVVQNKHDGRRIADFRSLSYNWQQGTRAQWLDGTHLAYNDFDVDAGRYVCRVRTVETGAVRKTFAFPVQDSFKREYFLSLDYRRLMALRPDYGYRNLPPLALEALLAPGEDGIWRVEYSSGTHRLIVSLRELMDRSASATTNQALHKVNHVMISPDGERFIFIHRWLQRGVRTDQLYCASAGTGKLTPLGMPGMVSHCTWLNEKQILGYLRAPDGSDGYYVVDTSTGEITPFLEGRLDHLGDGHPHAQGDWVVTDTYPDRGRMQHLLLINWKEGNIKELGAFFHGFEFKDETRCDLHPRLSPDAKSVYFDSVFTGRRSLYRMDISSA